MIFIMWAAEQTVCIVDSFDLAERNHVYDVIDDGQNLKRRFTQYIFWNYDEESRHVEAWRFDKGEFTVQSCGGRFHVIWKESNTVRLVIVKRCIETWSLEDPEVNNRAKFSESRRVGFSRR